MAHIAYLEGNYATALNGFETLKEVPGIGSIVRYYIAQIYYLQGRNQELLLLLYRFWIVLTPNDLQRLRV